MTYNPFNPTNTYNPFGISSCCNSFSYSKNGMILLMDLRQSLKSNFLTWGGVLTIHRCLLSDPSCTSCLGGGGSALSLCPVSASQPAAKYPFAISHLSRTRTCTCVCKAILIRTFHYSFVQPDPNPNLNLNLTSSRSQRWSSSESLVPINTDGPNIGQIWS